MADISAYLDKAFEGKEFSDLADAPIDALAGISAGDAEAIKKALGIQTIRGLAESKYVRVAQAIVALADVKK